MREGADPQVSAIFYPEVVQEVILFGVETRVFFVAMSRKLEGVHVGLLRQMMGVKAKRQRGGTWRSEVVKKVIKEAGTHILGEYIDKR